MKRFIRHISVLLMVFGFFSCQENLSTKKEKESFIKISTESIPKSEDPIIIDSLVSSVKIDSVSINEIKRYFDEELPSIFDYYNQETSGDYSNWSNKLFGRCCSNTDITFTENLFFTINSAYSDLDDEIYPISNLSDGQYLTAFVFKPESKTQIRLMLDKEKSYLDGKYSNKNLLDINEIIMNPIRLSLINGYVKSEELYYKNGRVKELEFFINKEYIQTVVLMDTPLVQELEINAVFKTNDAITLIPKSYYLGDTYDDICISEIQTNLGKTARPELNEKFDLIKLMNRGNE